MSSLLPYVAPWETGFKRYSTQIVTVPATATNVHAITVPQGQWWRIIYWEEDWNTSANVGDRFLTMFWQQGVKTVLAIGAPVVQQASQEYTYVFAPAGQAYSALPAGRTGFAQAPIPDMLWGPGTVLSTTFAGILALDTELGGVNLAVEVYTVQRDGTIVPQVAAPLIP